MSDQNRRSGFLATTEGVKKLKEAKTNKQYTYRQIATTAKETQTKVKSLFQAIHKIDQNAVQAICDVLDLKPEDIVHNWNAANILDKKHEQAYYEALKEIEKAKKKLCH